MKKLLCFILVCMLAASVCGCGCQKKEDASIDAPKYDTNAKSGDEGVIENEDGTLTVPATTEKHGTTNVPLVVKTPEKDGVYEVLTYNFPEHTLSSITYEVHFDTEEKAKSFYESQKTTDVTELAIEGAVVSYNTTDSQWIGYKKRDIIDNCEKNWEQFGYEVVSK